MLPSPDEPLRAILQSAIRRFRMPALPATLAAAQAAGPATAIAFALEALRSAKAGGAAGVDELRAPFARSLARLISEAMQPHGGDSADRALVLRARDGQVQEYVALVAQVLVDRRNVRAVVDAVAHPAKMARMPADASRRALIDHLAELRRFCLEEDWTALRAAAGRALEEASRLDDPASHPLRRLLEEPALARLERASLFQWGTRHWRT